MLLFIIASLLASASLVYLLLRLRSADTRDRRLTSLFFLCAVVLTWTLLNLFSAVVRPEYYAFIYTLKFTAFCIVPYITCWFFMNLAQSKFISSKSFKITIITLPALIIFAMVTNPLHRLFFLSYDYPVYPKGMLFWVYLLFASAITIFAYIIILRYVFTRHRHQPLMIIASFFVILPYALNVIYSFNLTGFAWDTTPLGYFVVVILFAYAANESQIFHFRSENLLNMYDAVEQVLMTINKQGNIVDANSSFNKKFPAFNPIFGNTPARDFINYIRGIMVSCIPENLLDLISNFENETATAISGEVDLAMPGNELKTFTINRYSIGQQGRNYAIVLNDVSDYRLIMNEVKRVQKLNSLMLDANPLCCELWDSNLDIIDCNKATLEFFGIEDKQLYIDGFHDLSPEFQPDGMHSEEKVKMCIKKAFEEGRFSFEWMHKFLDGSLVPVEVTLVPVENEGIIAVYLRDLREHKNMMANIDYRDALLNAVNQSANLLLNADGKSMEQAVYLSMKKVAEVVKVDCVYLWKNHLIDGKLYCSQEFEWSPEETVFTDGKLYSYKDVVPGWEEVLSKGDIINSLVRDMSVKEQEHLTPSGILSILVVPVFISEKFWGFVGYDDCHSERIFTKEEESILQSGSMLIANAFIRNEQIKLMLEGIERERNLEIQKQAAQAANEAKTHFLASMSHEIRTPMNAIIGMSDLLLSENLNVRQHRYAEDIKISSNALLDIINEILDLSKIHAAKLSLVPIHYDFKAFIENICSMTSFLVQDKLFSYPDNELNFVKDIQENIPGCLYGDDVRFRQVLLNLLGNAVKYTKVGIITFTIRFDDNYMKITVADTGIGISEENIPILFDAFEQADTEKNKGLQGTGLGLSIAKSLVELMGGNITVESKYGVGSSFHLTLPFELGDCDLIKINNDNIGIVYAPLANVLAVDDRESNLSVICGLLHQCHIIADKAISGAQAIEMVSKKQYDLIFLDHMMPEMDGVETVKILREMGIKIPVIALTANAVSGAKELLLSAGMDDYLSKPIDKLVLYELLAKWIPDEKITATPESDSPTALNQDDSDRLFWEKLNAITELNVEAGLDLVAGQLKTYKSTLEITMREIEKSMDILKEFPIIRDLKRFYIEVHGLKGSLANIGALGLSSKARKLESASIEGDYEFCLLNLNEFKEALNSFGNDLKDVFTESWKNKGLIKIPPELIPILNRISEAMKAMDFSVIYDEVETLSTITLTGVLKDEIEKLSEALLIMNYQYAEAIIERLLHQ